MQSYNEIKLSGLVKKVYPVISTINNKTVARFVLEHQSLLEENYQLRKVYCKMFCVIVNSLSIEELLNHQVVVYGFINHNSQKQLVLHVNKIEKLT